MSAESLDLRAVAVQDMKPGQNVRKTADAAAIEVLGASLKQRQLHPLVLGPDLVILDGWRRWLAAQRVGLKSLWAVIQQEPLSPEDCVTAQMVMAIHRKDLREQEKVGGYEQLAAACAHLDQKRLAERLQVDPATVSRWSCLSGGRVLPQVRDAFFDGRIALTAAYTISQAAHDRQTELLEFALSGATREQLSSRRRRSDQPLDTPRTARVRCQLPDGSSVTVSRNGLSVVEVIECLSSLLKEARRAQAQNLDVKTWERVMADRAKAADAP
ncbi:MAG: ParB/RepB/Spo0J family partition protein [Planctomycetaceae bacterium]|nr:ParB/RepB/Spo0J family partition protein [Planctomycetaceae bacterium]